MELFCFGILAGAIIALIIFCIMGVFRSDKDVDQGKPDDDNNIWSNDSSISELFDSLDPNYSWPYDKGSPEEKEELEYLIDSLHAIVLTGGLTSYETRKIKKIIGYAERNLGDD